MTASELILRQPPTCTVSYSSSCVNAIAICRVKGDSQLRSQFSNWYPSPCSLVPTVTCGGRVTSSDSSRNRADTTQTKSNDCDNDTCHAGPMKSDIRQHGHTSSYRNTNGLAHRVHHATSHMNSEARCSSTHHSSNRSTCSRFVECPLLDNRSFRKSVNWLSDSPTGASSSSSRTTSQNCEASCM